MTLQLLNWTRISRKPNKSALENNGKSLRISVRRFVVAESYFMLIILVVVCLTDRQ